MQKLDMGDSVGSLVRQSPRRSRVFDRYGIDFCCGGKRSLEDACLQKGIAVNEVLAEIDLIDQGPAESDEVDADSMSLTDLCEHIERTHHDYLRRELPRLDQMTEKVARVHGGKQASLIEIRQEFVRLRDELLPHLMKEEQILFPMIRTLEAGAARPQFHCGSVNNPIRQMEHEHDDAGESLKRLRELTDGFQPPDWACNTYRAMFDALHELEQNMHQHVHKENNVLFVKAAQLEAQFA